MSIELKPCPFCDSPAKLELGDDHHGEWFNLGCSNHGCIAFALFYTAAIEDKDIAIQKWNTRAGDQ